MRAACWCCRCAPAAAPWAHCRPIRITRNAFHSRQVELLATFANQAAISLDNARLYGELQSRLEEMVGLQRLGTLLLEEHDFDRVLQSICQQLQRLTDAGGVGLALLEEDPRFLEMRTVVGPSADVLRGARIPTEGSFAAEALRTNRSQRSDDAQNDPRGYKKSLVLGNTRTILSVPMKTRQRTVGVLSVYNKEGEGGFTDRDAELATFFANQAAAAIENARLYEQTREYAVVEERNRLARELHDSVTQSLFSVTLLSEAALSLLDRDPAKARERLERANELAQGALAEMRALIFQLRPMTLQEEGLLSAVKKHLSALHSRHGRVVELQVTGAERRLPAPIEDAAFGIIQESLNNVVKHANAARTQVQLRVWCGLLCGVTTVDDGVGFDPAAPRPVPTLGMSSMRERAEGSRRPAARRKRARPGHARSRADLPHPPCRLAPRRGPIRVLIVDDHGMVREGLRAYLELEPDIQVVGEARDGAGGCPSRPGAAARRGADGPGHAQHGRRRRDVAHQAAAA